ncbi:TIGR04086 family membrane protein [Desulfosporosinus sp. Sb-LF]|uniref:TIGR04086 family membrane protein n=1 Tax=Desulfosporosinus sp. Sb-LF TaxID=2560027 RepID=UPI00107F8B65|nr:TIGR04086 family membrane protein [Desulfosporosinus sp. Sb-LF]TGE31944.1 hypothetical protein E4K68_14755 [Desulfosporosinus sp. Sb-LF]
MGSYVLRGITTALLITVLTLFAGIVWGAMGLGGLSVSLLLDIGLFASCSVGGYRTAKESGIWFMGGAAGAGYVIVGTLLLALFLPIRGWGFIQILAEGAMIGLVAGAVGAGGGKGAVAGAWQGRKSSYSTPSYAGYGSDDLASSEFDWDTEEDLQKKRNTPSSQWIKNSESEFQEISEAKITSAKEPDVEWSWDREDENVKSEGSGYNESRYDEFRNSQTNYPEQCGMRETGLVRSDVVVNKRPWWEE